MSEFNLPIDSSINREFIMATGVYAPRLLGGVPSGAKLSIIHRINQATYVSEPKSHQLVSGQVDLKGLGEPVLSSTKERIAVLEKEMR